MNRIRTPTRLLALCLATAFAGSAFAHEPNTSDQAAPKKPAAAQSMAGHSQGSMDMHRIMMEGQKRPMPMSGDVDKDFATMMTMHHEMAIKMSDAQLQHGKSPELKELARKMQAAQREEIRKMAPYRK